MTLIEIIARALCEASGKDPDSREMVVQPSLPAMAVPDFDAIDPNWRAFASSAIQVLKALREPTEAMSDIGDNYVDGKFSGVDGRFMGCSRDWWQVMIEAAIAEGEHQ